MNEGAGTPADAGSGRPSSPRLRVLLAAAALLLVALIAGGVAFLGRPRPGRSPDAAAGSRDNLLLITLDTTRADRLGSYGRPAAKTRHLDRLAAEGVRFEEVIAPAPITLPSHVSLFTALYPTRHGVRNNGNFYLSADLPTLTTVLKEAGYRTGAFVSAFVLDRRYGLDRGFDVYDDRMEGAQPQVVALEAERRGDRTALALAAWLEAHAREGGGAPFFAWLHLYDPHEPYRPPRPFREMFAHDPYAGEIAFDDAIVASVLDKLGQLGLLERTLIAVTADHGESLGDHGEETHSMFVYEPAIRVPLLLWRPGRLPAGTVVGPPVRLTDLAPTLLDLLGAPPLPTPDGRSLRGLVEGHDAAPPPAAYAETYLPLFYMNWAPLRALRDERYKLIDAPRPELYDLARDPGEATNLYEREPARAAALRQALERIAGGEGEMSVGAVDRETAEKLAALGYLGAGEALQTRGDEAERADPKDVIAVFNRLRRANSAVRDRRFDEALRVLREVLDQDPRNAFARLVTGSAYMGMGRWREAVPWFERYLELVPTSAYAHHWIAICLLRAGDADGALREAAAALALDPRFSDARVLRGGVLAARAQYGQAIAELRAAVESDPAKPVLRLDLAKVLDEAGESEAARAEYEAALRAKPDYAPALVGLGALAARQGRAAEALPLLERALTLDPAQPRVRFDLAKLLEAEGRVAEAAAEYRRVAEEARADPQLSAEARRNAQRLKRRH